MEDEQIIALFFERSEAAIAQTAEKYGRYCYQIANNILRNEQDSEECVNDTFLRAWNAIPPHRPNHLPAFLGKITRNLALDRYQYNHREKRNRGQTERAFHELEDCIPAGKDLEEMVSDKALIQILNAFLADLPSRKRKIFVQRYWYFRSIGEIAKEYSLSESNVKVILLRTRKELKQYLEKEGVEL